MASYHSIVERQCSLHPKSGTFPLTGHFVSCRPRRSPSNNHSPFHPYRSLADREEIVRRMRERLKNPPDMYPPLLQRTRAGLGFKANMPLEELGKIESIDVRVVAGDINMNVCRRVELQVLVMMCALM